MRELNFNQNGQVVGAVDSLMITNKSYHEMADTPVVELDPVNQLHANLEMLSDLQARHSFLMREVRYLMKVQD